MSFITMVWHVLGFLVLPAFMAVVLPACCLIMTKRLTLTTWLIQSLWIFVWGLSVLFLGFVLTRIDGMLSTYLALVVVCALVQTFMMRKQSGTSASSRKRKS